ncbi:hypothetical protein NIES2104_44990 [Leptolyngbya sp. NIES-2104]|nr:hypothetical protein NIES2104_44990 [Leptolyngbya sp. NIES-2104]
MSFYGWLSSKSLHMRLSISHSSNFCRSSVDLAAIPRLPPLRSRSSEAQ